MCKQRLALVQIMDSIDLAIVFEWCIQKSIW
jgi:hypothetical protein